MGQARVCFTLNCGCMLSRSIFHEIVVVGLSGVCFMFSCGCWASRSVFHV